MASRSRTVLTALGLATALSACGSASGAAESSSGTERLQVAAAFYPYAYLAEQVGGDDVSVEVLTAAGVDPHDLELTARQVAALTEADLVVYAEGFQPALDEAVAQQDAAAFDAHTAVELREGEDHAEEEGHEGETAEEHAAHADEEGHAEEEGHEGETAEEHAAHADGDPHVWLDPERYGAIARALAERLGEAAPERAEQFTARAADLTERLDALDAELRTGLADCTRTEVVTSHASFGYLADRYGLEQVGIAGLSPEEEVSPGRLAELVRYSREHGVTTVFFEETVSPATAEQLAREVGAQAAELTPLEGPPADGDYFTAMRANLDALRTALDCS